LNNEALAVGAESRCQEVRSRSRAGAARL
jgi:hypothetical protein